MKIVACIQKGIIIIINDDTHEVIKELFDSLKSRYQNNLQSKKGSESAFNHEKDEKNQKKMIKQYLKKLM